MPFLVPIPAGLKNLEWIELALELPASQQTYDRFRRLDSSARDIDARAKTAVSICIRGRDGNQSHIRVDDLAIEQLRDFR